MLGTNYTLSQSEFAVALGIGLVVAVLMMIAGWKIFEKAGEKGWKILIPIYDIYIFFKIVKMEKWFWVAFALSFIAGLIAGFVNPDFQAAKVLTSNNYALLIVSDILVIVVAVIEIISYFRLSKAFGHGIAFALGLTFLSGIFMLILGFDKSKYNKKLVSSWK